jgi:hypothetical protein
MSAPSPIALLIRRGTRIGALALLICAALLANLARLNDLWELPPANVSEMSQRDSRFEQLRSALPKRGMVGYVTDAKDAEEFEVRLLLTQFSLAPLILVSSTEQLPIVGDFWRPESPRQGNPASTTLRDFGNGVVLFGRAEQ